MTTQMPTDGYPTLHRPQPSVSIIFAGVAYIALRPTFGGSPNLPTWCAFSEMVTDFILNEISLCTEWDHTKLRSPAQPSTPRPIKLPNKIPIALAMPMAVEIPMIVMAQTDSFIDDLIQVFLDTPTNRDQEPHTVPLAMHVTSRPPMGDVKPLKFRGLLSAPKLEAEGTPAEEQILLGWNLNMHCLMIILPRDKYEAWSANVKQIVDKKQGTNRELGSTLGKLNRVAYIIQLARHFLTKLRLCLHHCHHQNNK
jgi:hypothetical protein